MQLLVSIARYFSTVAIKRVIQDWEKDGQSLEEGMQDWEEGMQDWEEGMQDWEGDGWSL